MFHWLQVNQSNLHIHTYVHVHVCNQTTCTCTLDLHIIIITEYREVSCIILRSCTYIHTCVFIQYLIITKLEMWSWLTERRLKVQTMLGAIPCPKIMLIWLDQLHSSPTAPSGHTSTHTHTHTYVHTHTHIRTHTHTHALTCKCGLQSVYVQHNQSVYTCTHLHDHASPVATDIAINMLRRQSKQHICSFVFVTKAGHTQSNIVASNCCRQCCQWLDLLSIHEQLLPPTRNYLSYTRQLCCRQQLPATKLLHVWPTLCSIQTLVP